MTTTAPAAGLRAPRVSGLPVVGPLPELLGDALGLYERAQRECGDMARLVTGVPPARRVVHLVMHPDGARHVLSARGHGYGKDSPVYEELRAYIGTGLLTAQDEVWERQRRLVQPSFTPQRVAGYAEVVAQEADVLAAHWARAARAGRRVDLGRQSMRYALRVVGRLLLGSAVEEHIAMLERTAVPLQDHVVFRGLLPVRLPRAFPTPGARRAARWQRELFDAVDSVVAARRAAPGHGSGPPDLLDGLLAARDPLDGSALSPEQVRDQVLVFLLAGYETTANALTFAFFLLGHHPQVQARLREEADPLPYARQVVQEAMRLYPPVCHLSRSTRVDDEVLGRRVRAGEPVVIPTWVLHRDARWWPDPLRFDPDRFAEGAGRGRHRYAYLPFGAGQRACIGAQLSLLESSTAVAAVAAAVTITTPDRVPPLVPGIVLRPRDPLLAGLTPR